MTNGVATPNTCELGFTMLSEYCVAMAPVSLARGRSAHNRRRNLALCERTASEKWHRPRVLHRYRKSGSLPPTVRTACYTPSVHVGAAGTSPSWHNPYKD